MVTLPQIDGAHYLVHNEDVIAANCNDEVVLLRIETGRCYGMNDMGTHIWRRLSSPMRVAELVDALQSEFPAEAEKSLPEIFDFLAHLDREGLILRVDPPPPQALP